MMLSRSTEMVLSEAWLTTESTTHYTPEIRAGLKTEMHTDSTLAAETWRNKTTPDSEKTTPNREETAKNLKQDGIDGQNTLAALAEAHRIRIEFYGIQRQGARGFFDPKDNIIAHKTESDKDYFTEKDVNVKSFSTLFHERQHQLNHNKKMDVGGKEVSMYEAPMSLTQCAKLVVADEVSANIAACMALRQRYVELKTETDAAYLEICGKDKGFSQLKKGLDNGNITFDDISLTETNKKKVKLSFPDPNNRSKKVEIDVTGYQESLQKYLDLNKKTGEFLGVCCGANKNSAPYNQYFIQVRDGKFNPLGKDPTNDELRYIGESVSRNWKTMYANHYTEQIERNVCEYYDTHSLQDMKPNDKNYDAAFRAVTVIGGWDFSTYVSDNVNASIQPNENDLAEYGVKVGENGNFLLTEGEPKKDISPVKMGGMYARGRIAAADARIQAELGSDAPSRENVGYLQESDDTSIRAQKTATRCAQKTVDPTELYGNIEMSWTKENQDDYEKAIKLLDGPECHYSDEQKKELKGLMEQMKPDGQLTREQVGLIYQIEQLSGDYIYSKDPNDPFYHKLMDIRLKVSSQMKPKPGSTLQHDMETCANELGISAEKKESFYSDVCTKLIEDSFPKENKNENTYIKDGKTYKAKIFETVDYLNETTAKTSPETVATTDPTQSQPKTSPETVATELVAARTQLGATKQGEDNTVDQQNNHSSKTNSAPNLLAANVRNTGRC